MNKNIQGDFQTCISVPLNHKLIILSPKFVYRCLQLNLRFPHHLKIVKSLAPTSRNIYYTRVLSQSSKLQARIDFPNKNKSDLLHPITQKYRFLGRINFKWFFVCQGA